MGEWHSKRRFDTWEEFRDGFYYPDIVHRPWNGRPNLKIRRRDQTAEQEVHDGWRRYMGYDAPWTDVMVFYDHGKPIALGEIKRGAEGWDDSNRRAAEALSDMANIPLVLMRFWSPTGPIEVSAYLPLDTSPERE